MYHSFHTDLLLCQLKVYSLGIILFELCYPMYTGMERSLCLTRLRESQFPTDWQNAVGESFPTLKELITTMLDKDPSKRPTANAVSQTIQSILCEFTILSLDDKHGPEMVLLRVEAEHRDDALGHTIRLIESAAETEDHAPVNVVQYGLRSSSFNDRPTAIMEFALHFRNPKGAGPKLVSQLSKHPEIFKVRQVSRVGSISR